MPRKPRKSRGRHLHRDYISKAVVTDGAGEDWTVYLRKQGDGGWYNMKVVWNGLPHPHGAAKRVGRANLWVSFNAQTGKWANHKDSQFLLSDEVLHPMAPQIVDCVYEWAQQQPADPGLPADLL